MRYRTFGRTGWGVSDIGYGLWGMSGWSGSDDQQSTAALQHAADAGCTFFDSAWGYGEGKSDRLLGKLLKGNPGRRLYAASKIPPGNFKWPALPTYSYAEVFSSEHVFRYADEIRKNLGTDAIDLLQFHVWQDAWSDEPDFRNTVEKLKRDGIIRAFGLSLNRWEPANGLRAIRTGLVDTVQVIYNIFDQSPEDELFPYCEQHGIGVIVRVPFDEGALTGKLTPDTEFPAGDFRNNYFKGNRKQEVWDAVQAIVHDIGINISELPALALGFCLTPTAVSTVIPGMRSLRHVAANVAASDAGPLPPDVLAKLRQHRWVRNFWH